MANVMIIGGGGRERALKYKLNASPQVSNVFLTPVGDFEGLAKLAVQENVELTVVGPEAPLVDGIVNYWADNGLIGDGYFIFGPTKAAAQLEGSKVFAKEFMRRHDIPTASYETFRDFDLARDYVNEMGAPIVIKASGLAAGKGSIVCHTLEDAVGAVDDILVARRFGDAGDEVVIEEFMEGEEASIMALSDGNTVLPLVSSQDHKPAFENREDRARWLKSGGNAKYMTYVIGPNTGGMGAYAPAPVVTRAVMNKIQKRILEPTIRGMAEEGNPFAGCLYAGLIIKDGEPRVVEFNARFGDPETQVVFPLWRNDAYSFLKASATGNLHNYKVRKKPGAAACVVMASGGYPDGGEKGHEISGLDDVPSDVLVFHAGTKLEDGKYRTAGGRVLGVTGLGEDIQRALDVAYGGVDVISWKDKYNRTDIGERALERVQSQ